MTKEEKERESQRLLRSQVDHLLRLLDLMRDRMARIRTPLEADQYCQGVRDIIATIRDQITMQTSEACLHQIELMQVHITGRIRLLEDPMRQAQESLGNLDGEVSEIRRLSVVK